jgi:hypothetical protein
MIAVYFVMAGQSAKRVFAQMSRPSTSLVSAAKKDVDARDKARA